MNFRLLRGGPCRFSGEAYIPDTYLKNAEKCVYLIRHPKDAAFAEIKRQQSALFHGKALHASTVDMQKVLEIRGESSMKHIYMQKMKGFKNIYMQCTTWV